MSELEIALYNARVSRVTFDRTSDPLVFLHVIETKTRTAHTEYQRIMIIELSVEGPALDWFVHIIQLHMMTMTWAQFRERFMRRVCPDPL